MTPSKWIGASTIATLFLYTGVAFRNYSAAAFCVAVSTLLYFSLLKFAPAGARFLLCMGGALTGALLCGAAGLSLIGLFQDGWNVFGLMIWSAPVFAVVGGVPGFSLVLRWTEPPESGELSAVERTNVRYWHKADINDLRMNDRNAPLVLKQQVLRHVI